MFFNRKEKICRGESYDANDIAELFRAAIVTPKIRRIGIEIERIGMWPEGRAFQYSSREDRAGEIRPGAEQLLAELNEKHHWPLVLNHQGKPLGMTSPYGKVSLEPGSQLELSADPVDDLFTMEKTVEAFENEVEAVTQPWGLKWISLALNPINTVEEIELIPSKRYEIMTEYLPSRGPLGTSMMRLTSSVQINLDYLSEEEAVEMLRVALAVAPVSYALFANSPISKGQETRFVSYRGEIWRGTDPDRTGLIPNVFDSGFDFQKYAELTWARPLMFAQTCRNEYIPAWGRSLKDFTEEKPLRIVAGEQNQLNAIRETFTEARLKPGYVEIRSIDGQSPEYRYAAAAFWTGLMYDTTARKEALKYLGRINPAERDQLLEQTQKTGLRTKFKDIDVHKVALDLITAAQSTLRARGLGEEKFLEPLEQNAREGMCPADRVLKQFRKGATYD